MGTTIYKAGKKRIPSVTTITGEFKASSSLIAWAARLAKEGKDWERERNYAASVGTLAHKLCENHLLGCDLDADLPGAGAMGLDDIEHAEAVTLAGNSFQAFLSFCAVSHLETVTLEQSLVCQRLQFGGTFDWLARINTKEISGLGIVDFKTSKSIYLENCYQLAAYRHLIQEGELNENQVGIRTAFPELGSKIEWGMNLLLDKETGEFDGAIFSTELLDQGFETFCELRKCYGRKYAINKGIKEGQERFRDLFLR